MFRLIFLATVLAVLAVCLDAFQFGGMMKRGRSALKMNFAAGNLDPSKTAVVFIEYQNEFAAEGGKLYGAVQDSMATTQMLPKSVALAEECRKKGVKVIHAPISFTKEYKEVAKEPFGILANIVAGECFVAGEWGSDFVEVMKPAPEDIVVSGKRGLCGFASTNLDFLLRQNGIENVALAGFLTNCCVESTMRTAYESGYKVITVTDCCAATSKEGQDGAIANTFPMFSVPMTQEELMKKI